MNENEYIITSLIKDKEELKRKIEELTNKIQSLEEELFKVG